MLKDWVDGGTIDEIATVAIDARGPQDFGLPCLHTLQYIDLDSTQGPMKGTVGISLKFLSFPDMQGAASEDIATVGV